MEPISMAVSVARMWVNYFSKPEDVRETSPGSEPAKQTWAIARQSMMQLDSRTELIVDEFEKDPEFYQPLVTRYLQKVLDSDVQVKDQLTQGLNSYLNEQADQRIDIRQESNRIKGGYITGDYNISIGSDVSGIIIGKTSKK